MKKILAIILSTVFMINAFKPVAYASGANNHIIDDISYSCEILGNTTHYQVNFLSEGITSEIYEYFDGDVKVIDVYEEGIHNIIKIYPNGEMWIDDTLAISKEDIRCVKLQNSSGMLAINAYNSQKGTVSPMNMWRSIYNEGPLGGVASGYDDNRTVSSANLPGKLAGDVSTWALGTLCIWVAGLIFTVTPLPSTLASLLFTAFMATYKETASLAAPDSMVYASYIQTRYTNNDVSTSLAYYYKHDFQYFASKDFQNPIHLDEPACIYELYFFN